MWALLKQNGLIVSEKVVRKIMKEENLVVYVHRKKKKSSIISFLFMRLKMLLETLELLKIMTLILISLQLQILSIKFVKWLA